MNCSNISDKGMCDHVQLCPSDQVCKVEKFDLGNGFQYNMGCSQVQTCTSKRSVDGRASGSVPICSHCCRPDFCNLNCTSTVDPGTGIIG
ncbi:uncharacterized protein LOC128548857 isoform X2 [Mercenaria mercenaria]|nr:uncharacterized protein LOC128548857 isoform X2 [Mercenaria mercenaria]